MFLPPPPPASPYVFSVFAVSVAISKVVRLAAYVSIVPATSFILYFPTFWVFDINAVCIARLLLWQQARGLLANAAFYIALFMTILTLFGAASQVGFFIKTGTELDWADAPAFVSNKNSIAVLLSGSWRVLASASFILTTAYFVHQPLYRVVGSLNTSIGQQACYAARCFRLIAQCLGRSINNRRIESLEQTKFLFEDRESHGQHTTRAPLLDDTDSDRSSVLSEGKARGIVCSAFWLAVKACLLVIFVAGCFLRPSRPYAHISSTLPASLAVVLNPGPTYCSEQLAIFQNDWPLPELIDKSRWKKAKGSFKGWAPGGLDSDLVRRYRAWTPSWLPKVVPRGFARWNPRRIEGQDGDPTLDNMVCSEFPVREAAYNPVDDPLRITNLDQDILEPIREALDQGSVKIKHVVYILMESLRTEFFPLQQGSDIHKAILDLSPEEERAMFNERLAQLTPHIERITGVKGGFIDENGVPYPAPGLKWNDTVDVDHGGINVVGAYTAATMSTKSFAVNHCGAWAMPVETFDEAATDSYQPCMPQILNLMSDLKDDEEAARSGDFRDQKWFPALFESMVESYDRQEVFDRKVGFKKILTREGLERQPDFDRSDPKYQKVNYFGFAEQVLKPHIRKYIRQTVENNQRIWMSHFTSTTHHAWKTPDWFNTTDYMPTGPLSMGHRYFNRYLNTIRFHDAWMAELMELLEDTGIANETLVVFAGDHGMAFHEDDGIEGTYGNAHISNLRVPITFRHPHLPRVQYHANATTMSTLPTILDLLIHSGSLKSEDAVIASDLIHEYEGQSLIRPYKSSEGDRRAWNFAVINSGGKMLAVTSADAPWLLVIPFSTVFPYRFANIATDPLELDPIVSWTMEDVMQTAGDRYGPEAASWAREAELVGKWWNTERKRLWAHHSKRATG